MNSLKYTGQTLIESQDNTKEAKNSTSGYKHTVSSGTQGVGDILKK